MGGGSGGGLETVEMDTLLLGVVYTVKQPEMRLRERNSEIKKGPE